jgi:NADH-quinone oxidoreductase subunit J
MEMPALFFYAFAGFTLLCATMVVLKKNPVASAFSLVLVFFGFAGIYALMEAHLIAALQILVYAGAIMVLFLFVIMLLNADVPSFDARRSHPALKLVGVVLSAALFAAFAFAFQKTAFHAPVGPHTTAAIEASGGNTQVLSELLFSEYILPFELTSVLLLAAIVGAVAIAKRRMT